MLSRDIEDLNRRVEEASRVTTAVLDSVRGVIVGQEYLLRRLLIGLLADGHLLLEGVPGLAKTLAVSTLAQSLKAVFSRVQFTPDLLPADLTGTLVYNQKSMEFTPRKGPVFANFVLADEINRAPAKVQSALLESMQERQVTIGDHTYKLPEPFLVLATQNPIEQEGTFPLPEAQLDRFMLKLVVGYPSREEERLILERMVRDEPIKVNPVASHEDILALRGIVKDIFMETKIKEYILDLVFATREPKGRPGLKDMAGLIELGASPRATLNLARAAKAHAFLERRGWVTPDDVKAIGRDVLRHRIVLTYEAEAEQVSTDDIVGRLFDEIPVP